MRVDVDDTARLDHGDRGDGTAVAVVILVLTAVQLAVVVAGAYAFADAFGARPWVCVLAAVGAGASLVPLFQLGDRLGRTPR